MAGRLVHDVEQLVGAAPLQSFGVDESGGYRGVGEGPRLLVVLPGLVGPADALAALARALGTGWRVAFVTYPRVDSLTTLIEWLEAIRRREGAGVVAVCGGSFGGLVAQAWLRSHPASVGDIVLSGTGPPDPVRAAKNAKAIRWMARLPMAAWRAALRLAVWASTRRVSDRAYWRSYYAESIRTLTWDDLESRYRISIGVDEGGPLDGGASTRWRGRMLVLEGERDRVASSRVRGALRATYPAATFHTFRGAGHSPALERPDDWLRVVVEFLNRE
jgi:pimeloyl-ACP methyl ester carboxylesterase